MSKETQIAALIAGFLEYLERPEYARHELAHAVRRLLNLDEDLRRLVYVTLRDKSYLRLMTPRQIQDKYGDDVLQQWGMHPLGEEKEDESSPLFQVGIVETTCMGCRQGVTSSVRWVYFREGRVAFGPACANCSAEAERRIMRHKEVPLETYSLNLDHSVHATVADYLSFFTHTVRINSCQSLDAVEHAMQQWLDGESVDHAFETEDDLFGAF